MIDYDRLCNDHPLPSPLICVLSAARLSLGTGSGGSTGTGGGSADDTMGVVGKHIFLSAGLAVVHLHHSALYWRAVQAEAGCAPQALG